MIGSIRLEKLSPFQFDLQAFSNGEAGAWQTGPLERLLNVLLFLPLGYALASVVTRKRWHAVALAAALSVGIELTQALIASRNSDVLDVAANTLGAALGAQLTRWPLPAAGAWFWRAAFAGWIAALSLLMLPVTHTLYLADWDDDYSVELGDEVGGGRKYEGQLHSGLICVGRDREERCQVIRGPAGLGAGWAELAERSQKFKLEVSATAGRALQSGPARLITWSRDPYSRNVTLAQEDDDAIVRARTLGSTENGTGPAFRFPGAFEGVQPGDSFSATAVWDKGRLTLTIESAGWSYSREILLRPARLVWLQARRSAYFTPRNPGYEDMIAVAIVALPTGMAAAGLFASLWVGVLSIPLVAVALLWLPTLLSGISSAGMYWTAPLLVGAALLGWALAWSILDRPTASR
jgi:hypothetical protein